MSTWSILQRLFLVFALVFNGATPVMASVHMDRMGSSAETIQPAAAAEEPPCHQQVTDEVAATDRSAVADADQGKAPPPPDCCDSGGCLGACVHHVAVIILDFGIPAPVVDRAISARPMRTGHAAPALPNLTRPPIC